MVPPLSTSPLLRRTLACLVTSAFLCTTAPLAQAQEPPPEPAPFTPPSADPIGPDIPTEQRSQCAVPQWSGADATQAPAPQLMLELPRVHQIATGSGQRVAVIDTGVEPNPRLKQVTPGGDYVSDGDGLHDCDGHGTMVAGLIAASPSDNDAFVGIAPDAEIISIRQASNAFGPADRNARQNTADNSHGYGNVSTLARAVVRAVDLGANVINISQVACGTSIEQLDDASLHDAIRFAYERNVVVVVAAGNLQGSGPCQTQNPRTNPGNPDAGTGSMVNTYVTPARFDQYSLAVSAVSPQGEKVPFSLSGPWVGVAAPGTDIVSLSSTPDADLTNLQETDSGLTPYIGTSFSTAYVAGLAALLREKHPDWSAQQVIDQIKRTAHAPQSGPNPDLGSGVIDPLAALTTQAGSASAVRNQVFVPPPPPPGPNPLPRKIAVIGASSLLVVLVCGALIASALRREPKAVATADGLDDTF